MIWAQEKTKHSINTRHLRQGRVTAIEAEALCLVVHMAFVKEILSLPGLACQQNTHLGEGEGTPCNILLVFYLFGTILNLKEEGLTWELKLQISKTPSCSPRGGNCLKPEAGMGFSIQGRTKVKPRMLAWQTLLSFQTRVRMNKSLFLQLFFLFASSCLICFCLLSMA